ncbi:TOMM precursor leader peptide-binding protein [Paenibacillus sp. UNC451MF]|uniref:TOMM precursor leader peptide-binding protein n=1 Tax=Paenibacillus sp. UNC451MF TaxID=1449063 RepID=UPI00048B154C|nr:TOMM precursor leader peptide-binding protein [Paenibacillus sp. UNC451MF]
MNAVVTIVGAGQLADYVSKDLASQFEVSRQEDWEVGIPEAAQLVIVLSDGWDPSLQLRTEELLQPAGIPWFGGFVTFGDAVLGPLVRPGVPGCSQCAERRRIRAGQERWEMTQLRTQLVESGGSSGDAWASRTGLRHAAYLLGAEIRSMLLSSKYKEGSLVLLNLSTLECTRHFVLPDSLCPLCSLAADDTAEAALLVLEPCPKLSADSYRTRTMNDLKHTLNADYLDYRTGLLNGEMTDLVSPFADASVNLPLINEDVGTAGRTHSFDLSHFTAILEGVERYSSLEPRAKRTVISGSYRELSHHALNPFSVGVHSQEQYARDGFPFKPFDPEASLSWVWGYSLTQERPILVPEQLAYYSMTSGNPYVFESSNGCALGGSLVEAALYGILEVVERDSFLMTWYGRLPIPELDLSSSDDTELLWMVERLRAISGFDVRFFNSTMEHGIPSVWGVAQNRKQSGMNLICAAGAHLDPIRAVKGSLHELAGMVINLDSKLEAKREACESMLHDSSLVWSMDDHALLYGLPQAEERLHFLLGGQRPLHRFDEQFKSRTVHADLTEDVKDIIQAFRRCDLDVVVVDVTAPEIERNGLYCVKVLIPGLLPMTFGHHYTRVTGLERIFKVPVQLGYAKHTLTPEQLNPYPHPFP